MIVNSNLNVSQNLNFQDTRRSSSSLSNLCKVFALSLLAAQAQALDPSSCGRYLYTKRYLTKAIGPGFSTIKLEFRKKAALSECETQKAEGDHCKSLYDVWMPESFRARYREEFCDRLRLSDADIDLIGEGIEGSAFYSTFYSMVSGNSLEKKKSEEPVLKESAKETKELEKEQSCEDSSPWMIDVDIVAALVSLVWLFLRVGAEQSKKIEPLKGDSPVLPKDLNVDQTQENPETEGTPPLLNLDEISKETVKIPQEIRQIGEKYFKRLSSTLQEAAINNPKNFASLVKDNQIFTVFSKVPGNIQMLLLVGSKDLGVDKFRENFKRIHKHLELFAQLRPEVQSICLKNPGPFILSEGKDILKPRFFDLDERVQLLFLSDKEDHSKARANFSQMSEEALDAFFKSSVDKQIEVLKK